VNAAFLLVTGAMLVGQGGDKKVTPATPAPATSAATSCCQQDPCGCEGWGHRLRHKLGGLFNRNNNCDQCQPTCCDQKQQHSLFHRDRGCNDCGRTKFWNHQPTCQQPKTCAPTCTDSCGHGSSNLLSNLRHRFGRNECCDGGCNNGCASGTPGKAGEKIEAPKKMPVETPKKTNGNVRIDGPVTPNTIQATPSAVEITPIVPVPRVEGDRRDPF